MRVLPSWLAPAACLFLVMALLTFIVIVRNRERDEFVLECNVQGGYVTTIDKWGGKYNTETYVCTAPDGTILEVK